MYKHIKKEHVFIFLVLFASLVLFTYFDKDFSYTSLTVKESCTDKGYQCCNSNEGLGVNYFSLDNTCNNNKQCWNSCVENIKETNLITSSAVLDNIWSPIKNFFIKLFKREVRGGLGSSQCNGKPTLFTISGEQGGSHASKSISGNDAYSISVCSISNQFQQTQDNNADGYILLKLSSEINAHVEKKELINYNTPIYIKPVGEGSIECSYSQIRNSECLFSISGETDAHVGACEQNNQNIPIYDIKIWCKINPQPGTPHTQCSTNNGICTSVDAGCNQQTQNQAQYSCGIGLMANEFVCCIQKQQGSTLTIVSNPIGGGTVTKNLDKTNYNLNEQVTLTAIPSNIYSFSGWASTEGITLENAQLTQNPLTISMPQNSVRITAIFRQGQCNNNGIKGASEQCD